MSELQPPHSSQALQETPFASEATKERVADLVAREKTSGLNAAEAADLESYLQLEHVMRLARARARFDAAR